MKVLYRQTSLVEESQIIHGDNHPYRRWSLISPLSQVDYTSDLLPRNRRWKRRDTNLTVERLASCYLNLAIVGILRGCLQKGRTSLLCNSCPQVGHLNVMARKPQTNPNRDLFYKTVNQFPSKVTRSEKTR